MRRCWWCLATDLHDQIRPEKAGRLSRPLGYFLLIVGLTPAGGGTGILNSQLSGDGAGRVFNAVLYVNTDSAEKALTLFFHPAGGHRSVQTLEREQRGEVRRGVPGIGHGEGSRSPRQPSWAYELGRVYRSPWTRL